MKHDYMRNQQQQQNRIMQQQHDRTRSLQSQRDAVQRSVQQLDRTRIGQQQEADRWRKRREDQLRQQQKQFQDTAKRWRRQAEERQREAYVFPGSRRNSPRTGEGDALDQTRTRGTGPGIGRHLSQFVVASLIACLLIALIVVGGWAAYRSIHGPSSGIGNSSTSTSGSGTGVNGGTGTGTGDVRIPQVDGDDAATALEDLQNAGLDGVPVFQASATVPGGAVITTVPRPGTRVPEGSNLSVIVSCGPESDGACG